MASRRRGAGRQPTCEHADLRDPEAARSDGSASTLCCVVRGAGISVHGTAVTDRRWPHPIVDAITEEYASERGFPACERRRQAAGTTTAADFSAAPTLRPAAATTLTRAGAVE